MPMHASGEDGEKRRPNGRSMVIPNFKSFCEFSTEEKKLGSNEV